MDHRSEDCRYCPPHSYLAHARCHEQSIQFNYITRILNQHKENIPIIDLIAIVAQKQWLDSLNQPCITEHGYYIFMLALQKFNKTLEVYLSLRGVRLQ